MTDDEIIPRWLVVVFACLRRAPMTELKTAVGLVLLCCTALWLALAAAFSRYIKIDAGLLDSWLLFLSGLLAITSFGQGWKQAITARVQSSAPPAP